MGDKDKGQSGFWSDLFRGSDSEGDEVSARFGEGPNEGHTLLSDGHKSAGDFKGSSGGKGHDHYDGRGGGTNRGQYTGKGSK